jgi:hypothetical protein
MVELKEREKDVEDTGMILPPIPSDDDFLADPKVRATVLLSLF